MKPATAPCGICEREGPTGTPCDGCGCRLRIVDVELFTRADVVDACAEGYRQGADLDNAADAADAADIVAEMMQANAVVFCVNGCTDAGGKRNVAVPGGRHCRAC